MRLYAYDDPLDGMAVGLRERERIVPLPAWDVASSLLEDELASLRAAAAPLTGAVGLDPETLQPRPAVMPGKVICVGLNYADHAAEGGRPTPERPLLFAKF